MERIAAFLGCDYHPSMAQIGLSPEDTGSTTGKYGIVKDNMKKYSRHLSKTDSAVRLTHIPSGIVVACQAERSQHKNRAAAWDMLRARLYEAELQKREAAAQQLEDSKTEIGWGRQIRSYVLQPYQMVKDLRTGVETSDTQGVLDGDLDPFMAASLAARVSGAGEKAVEDID
jgi:peptide chain release factor 2